MFYREWRSGAGQVEEREYRMSPKAARVRTLEKVGYALRQLSILLGQW